MRQIEAMGRNNNGVLSIHKKEAASLRRELDKLQKNLGGIAEMENKPGAIFIVDICREQNAVKEAMRLGIPLVAIVDTNADPDPIEYVIPGNDDAVRGVKMIADAFAKVIKEANDEYSRIASERQHQKEAEQANQEAQERANRKARKDADGEVADKAKAKLTETRKRAAKAAKAAVDAKAASVETAPAEVATAEVVTVEAAPAEAAPAAAE
jgi:small subunit ribosomal protein S2